MPRSTRNSATAGGDASGALRAIRIVSLRATDGRDGLFYRVEMSDGAVRNVPWGEATGMITASSVYASRE